MSNPIYYENITIDVTSDTIKLSYATFDTIPQPKPPKSGFSLKREEPQTIEEFRKEGFKVLIEHLNKIQEGSFKDSIKESI